MDRKSLLLAGAAAALVSSALAAAPTPAKISVTTNPSDSMSEPVYAKSAGFFAAAGLDADVQLIPNGAAIISAVASGAADVGGTNVASLVLACSKGVPVKILAPGGVYDGSAPLYGIVVAKDSPLKTLRELEGQTIAVQALRSIGDFASRLAVEKAGGDSSKLHLIEMPFAEMGPAVLQGRIAAASIAEPFFTQVKPAMRVLSEPYAAVAPQFMVSAFIASTAWLAANPELAARFAAALRSTASWANKNRPKTAELLSTTLKIDPTLLASMGRITYAQTSLPALIQPNIDLLLRYKQLDAPIAASSMIYTPPR